MKLLFATTNANKVPGPAKAVAPFGIELVHAPLDIPELQAETAAEVAREKARWAFARLGQPVMVIDSAFHIDMLGGFPGINVKWVTRQIGPEGYLRLMAPWQAPGQRRCRFEDALACAVDASAEPRIFVRRAFGRLAGEVRGPDRPDAKSPVWRLFIPEGFDLTVAEMTAEQLARHRAGIKDVYEDFARWFASR